MTSRIQPLLAALRAPRDISAIAVFRVALGAIVAVSAVRFLAYGWIDDLFTGPSFHFRYWGFGWLPVPPPAVTHALFAASGVLGLLVALGAFYRVSIVLLFLLFTYLQLVDVTAYLNHYYLVTLLLGILCVVPAHRALSLDAWRRPDLRREVLPAWCTVLLRFQVAVVYVNAGLAKATKDWLLHAQPLNIWLSARTDLPLVGPFLDTPMAAYAAAWAGFLFDTTIAGFLLWRRTRRFAYAAVLLFHFGTHVLFPQIGMFPVIMTCAALVFFEPSWPRALYARLPRLFGRRTQIATAPTVLAQPPVASSRWTHIGALTAAAFVTLQLAIPLRTHLYGGNVLWHEQGMRFSWRVMARAKNGSVTYRVRDPQSGATWHVSPRRYLTPVQEREMATQPDLILQLAHRIADDFANDGHPGVEVRVDARVSLNGRAARALIDPDVDLARAEDGLSPKPWITAAPSVPPPQLRSLRNL